MLHDLPRVNHSSLLPTEGHNSARVCIAYNVAGKKPVVHRSGLNHVQFPTIRSVYSGYSIGFGGFCAMVRIFEDTKGENSSEGGLGKIDEEAEVKAYSRVEDARTDRRRVYMVAAA